MAWVTRLRGRVVPQNVVGHWTGGYGSGAVLKERMANRVDRKTGKPLKLSVHYNIAQDGHITQYEDASKTICLHAGYMNAKSIGIEVTGLGHSKTTSTGVNLQKIKGRQVVVHNFTPEQVISWVSLVTDLCNEFGIPKRIPAEYREYGVGQMLTYTGVCGHLHCSYKLDPGTQLLEALVDDGFDRFAL